MLSNWNVPVSEARPRIPNSRANLHIDNFLNAADECNPAVLFKNHDALHPELIDKIEECLEGPKDFHVEIAKYGRESCEISNINKMRNEISSQEKGLTGLATKLSVSNSVSQECNSDVVVDDGRSDVGKQVEEKKFMSQNQNSFCHCKDVGFNVSECLECNSSQEAENVSSSPSFIAAAPEKASAKVPAPKIDIQMLIKM
ncbi:uncharacterized protein LOC114746645 [Neltuma alba]|uniref:uncharacterized protein LOC114746645 n=1 Tax=Neltuma alba TaxID=207710 RepID=UPI0010A5630C|nr:uncharacterized protein LOC114746645 [Prosopis alba]